MHRLQKEIWPQEQGAVNYVKGRNSCTPNAFKIDNYLMQRQVPEAPKIPAMSREFQGIKDWLVRFKPCSPSLALKSEMFWEVLVRMISCSSLDELYFVGLLKLSIILGSTFGLGPRHLIKSPKLAACAELTPLCWAFYFGLINLSKLDLGAILWFGMVINIFKNPNIKKNVA